MITTRTILLIWCISLVLCACGEAEMSLTEYVDRINGIESRASRQADELAAQAEAVTDLTPRAVQIGLEQAREIRMEVKEAADEIDPPEQVAQLHFLIFDWHARFMAVEEDLAARMGAAEDTEADWAELSDSPEMAAYRDAMAEGKEVCGEFQDELDATAERGVFAENPWIPGDMKEVVEAVLGCAWFPENPQDVYRYPTTTLGAS